MIYNKWNIYCNTIYKNHFMKRTVLIILLFLLFSSGHITNAQIIATFSENNAFNYGEELIYKLRYSLYINVNVGEAKLMVASEPKLIGNKAHYHISAEGKSYKFYDAFMKVRDRYESYVNATNFLPSTSMRVINEGRYHFDDFTVYNHYKREAKNKKGKVHKIGTNSQDILSAIYLARTLDYSNAKKGDSFLMNVFIDDSNYVLGMRYLGKETVKGKDGNTYKCLKLSPILIIDRVFKTQNAMILWVSDDKNKIPVKIYAAINVGAVYVDLYQYKGLKNPFQAKL
jgi:hypothetical protein